MFIIIKNPQVKRILILIGVLCVVGGLFTSLVYNSKELKKRDSQDNDSQDRTQEVVYGEYLEWSEVNKMFPKNAEADVIDFASGATFRVQRRGGTSHADVQPLTAEDTAIMKNIYSGNWSWKRKAIFLQLDDGRKIAASMHGMPHGQGALKNNFPGHFCIHFKGCKTHGSNSENLAHQMMIWKAAGILEEQLVLLSGEKAIETFITALHQNDQQIYGLLLLEAEPELIDALANIENVSIDRIKSEKENEKYYLELQIKYRGVKQLSKPNIYIDIIRTIRGYKIDNKCCYDLIIRDEQ